MVALAVPAVSDSDLRRCDSFVGTAFKFREELQHLGPANGKRCVMIVPVTRLFGSTQK